MLRWPRWSCCLVPGRAGPGSVPLPEPTHRGARGLAWAGLCVALSGGSVGGARWRSGVGRPWGQGTGDRSALSTLFHCEFQLL